MTASVEEEVAAKLEISGASIEIVDYEWHRGDTICEREEQHLLRWRVFPSQIGVSPLLASTERKLFGRLMFFPANAEVRTDRAGSGERSRCITCRFNPRWFGQISSLPMDWNVPDLIKSLDMSNPHIDQIIQRLGSEVGERGHASESFAKALAEVLVIEIARHFMVQQTPKIRTKDAVLPPNALQRISDYVTANAAQNISVPELAKLCGVSASHLSRAYKNTTGQTVHAFIADMRVQKAKTLLATDMPLKVISHLLGFSDASAFSNAFRKSCGIAPSAYRYRLHMQ